MDNDASSLTLLVQKCTRRPTFHMDTFANALSQCVKYLMLLLIKHFSSHRWI